MKRLQILCLALALAAPLSGCSGNATVSTTATAPISKAEIAAIEVTLTETVNVANTCLNVMLGPCGVPTTRAVIIADIHKAYDAFKRLQASSAAGSAAALAVLQEAIRQLTIETPAIKPGA